MLTRMRRIIWGPKRSPGESPRIAKPSVHCYSAGKSAIHGWGAFAKLAHAKGDMITEYCGDLVRPSVADLLERRQYDTLVGAGTYIFRLSDDAHVDATRRGGA